MEDTRRKWMNIKLIFASTAALAMVAGSPAFAAKSQDQQAIAADNGGGGQAEKKTCRTFANSASRMKSERICLTRAEWKKFEQEQAE
jgi:hypothetical protein